MALPHPSDNRFIQDVQVLLKRRPMVMAVGASVIGLVAIALGTQSLFQNSLSLNESETSDLVENTATGNETLRENERFDEGSEINTDIDTLENLLRGSEPNEDSEHSTQQSLQGTDRLPSSLLDPTNLIATSATTAQNQSSTQNQQTSSSMYEDLFQPITLSNRTEISASVPSLLPTTQPAPSTDQQSVLGSIMRSSTYLNGSESASEPTEPLSFGLPVSSGAEGRTIDGNLTNASDRTSLDSNRPTPNQRRSSSSGIPNVEPTSVTNGIFSTPIDGSLLQTSPRPGTTGYTIPQSLQSPVNPYTQQVNPQFAPAIPRQSILPPSRIAPNVYPLGAPFVPSGAQTSVNLSPSFTPALPFIQQPGFTIPQNSFATPAVPPSTPPRFNGGGRGGEINTFSNP